MMKMQPRPIDANMLLDIYTSPTYRTTHESMMFVDTINKIPTIKENIWNWIPCNKELPKEINEYLCSIQVKSLSTGEVIDNYVSICDFDGDTWCIDYNEEVMAWM